MGYLKEVHGMTLLGKTPEGTCQECAVKHSPEQPHNRDSLAYQYKFYDKGDITGFSMGGVGNYSEEDVELDEVTKQAGGTFDKQVGKDRPGTYINFQSGKHDTVGGSDRGIVIIPLKNHNYGPKGEFITLTAAA